MEALKRTVALDGAFNSAQRALLESLYVAQFRDYIKLKIVELGNVSFSQGGLVGLSDSFVLSNPRLRVRAVGFFNLVVLGFILTRSFFLQDYPTVFCSDGFFSLMGYTRSQILGQNCHSTSFSVICALWFVGSETLMFANEQDSCLCLHTNAQGDQKENRD